MSNWANNSRGEAFKNTKRNKFTAWERKQIIACLKRRRSGMTDRELAIRILGNELLAYRLRPRRNELMEHGYVKADGSRRYTSRTRFGDERTYSETVWVLDDAWKMQMALF